MERKEREKRGRELRKQGIDPSTVEPEQETLEDLIFKLEDRLMKLEETFESRHSEILSMLNKIASN